MFGKLYPLNIYIYWYSNPSSIWGRRILYMKLRLENEAMHADSYICTCWFQIWFQILKPLPFPCNSFVPRNFQLDLIHHHLRNLRGTGQYIVKKATVKKAIGVVSLQCIYIKKHGNVDIYHSLSFITYIETKQIMQIVCMYIYICISRMRQKQFIGSCLYIYKNRKTYGISNCQPCIPLYPHIYHGTYISIYINKLYTQTSLYTIQC